MSYITKNSKIVTYGNKWLTTDYVPPKILDAPMVYNSDGGNPVGGLVYDWHSYTNLIGRIWQADVAYPESLEEIHVSQIQLPMSQPYSLPNTAMTTYKNYWSRQNQYPYNDAPSDNYLPVKMGLFEIGVVKMTGYPYGWRAQESTTTRHLKLKWSYDLGKQIRDFWDDDRVLFFGGTYSTDFTIKKGAQLMMALYVTDNGSTYVYHYTEDDRTNLQMYPYNGGDPYTSSYGIKLVYEKT